MNEYVSVTEIRNALSNLVRASSNDDWTSTDRIVDKFMSEHPRLVQGGAEFFCRKALTRMVDDIFRQMGEAETDGQTQLNLGGVRVQRFFTVKRFGKNSKGFKARVPFRKLKLAELKEIIEGKKKPKKLSRDYEKLQILIEDLEKKGVSFDLTIEELGE